MATSDKPLRPLIGALEDHGDEGIGILTATPARFTHLAIYVMVALVLVGLAWSFFGRADVLVMAPGTLVPASEVRRLYAPIDGELANIYIAEGQPVLKGDVVARLYARGAIEAARNALEARLKLGDVAAFVFEPIQGKGVNIASEEYLLGAQELCRKYGTLMVCDEVQSGMGRTGRFLASQWIEGFQPDVICLSKALSGGYIPVGATITRRAVYDSVYDSMHRAIVHASTFGMGNMAMAAGLASLSVLDDEKLPERAIELGTRFRKGIEAMVPRFEFLKGVRQRGLMIAIEFGQPESMTLRAAWAMVNKMDENLFAQAIVLPLLDDHHILTQVAGHAMPIVKILPPLNISESDVDWFLDALEDVMIKLHKFPGPAWEVLKKLGNHALTSKRREGRVSTVT